MRRDLTQKTSQKKKKKNPKSLLLFLLFPPHLLTPQTTDGALNMVENAWTNSAGAAGSRGPGGSGSPFPAQVRYKPTRVKQTLSMSACRSVLRFVPGGNNGGDRDASSSNNKRFRLDLTPEETATLVKLFHAGSGASHNIGPGSGTDPQPVPKAVSYTHLTLPTILLV